MQNDVWCCPTIVVTPLSRATPWISSRGLVYNFPHRFHKISCKHFYQIFYSQITQDFLQTLFPDILLAPPQQCSWSWCSLSKSIATSISTQLNSLFPDSHNFLDAIESPSTYPCQWISFRFWDSYRISELSELVSAIFTLHSHSWMFAV